MNKKYYQKVQLPSGEVHVYAGPELFASLDYKVIEMADNNLQIPKQAYMSYQVVAKCKPLATVKGR